MSAASNARQGMLSALADARFRWLWIGLTVSGLGSALTTMAFTILITTRTSSPLAISGMLVANMLPMLVLGPFAGALADRWDKRRIMLLSDLSRAAIVALALVEPPNWALYVIAAASQTAGLVFAPARSVSITEIVGRERMVPAMALTQMAIQATQFVGPAAAGAVVGLAGTRVPIVLDVASFLISAACTLAVRFPAMPVREGVATARIILRETGEGVRFLWHDPAIRFLIQTLAMAGLGMGFVGVLVVDFARNSLGLDAARFGVFESAFAVGSLIGAFLAGQWAARWPRSATILGALALMGVGSTLFALRPIFLWACGIHVLLGLAQGGLLTPIMATMAERVPVDIRGRVFGATNTLINAMVLVGLGFAGPLAALIGASATFLAMGALVTGVAIVSRLRAGYAMLNAEGRPRDTSETTASGAHTAAGGH